jgi:hypothetical protein
MAKKKDHNKGEDLILKSARFYASDLIYLDWLTKRGALPFSVYMRDAVHQLVEMCRRHDDQIITPFVMVPRRAAEKAGLIPPAEEEPKAPPTAEEN